MALLRKLNPFGPFVAKELLEVCRRPRYYLVRVSLALVVLAAMAVVSNESGDVLGGLSDLPEFGRRCFVAWLWCQACVLGLLTPPLVGGLIAWEREQGSLDLLFTTDLRDYEIVLGKVASRLAVLFLVMASALPVVALLSLFGGIDYTVMALGTLAAAGMVVMLAGVSLYFSLTSSKPWVAVLRTYFAMAVAWVVVPFAAAMLYMALSPDGSRAGPPGAWFWLPLGLLHPIFQMGVLTIPGVPIGSYVSRDDTILLGSGLYVLIGISFVVLAIRGLRRPLLRRPHWTVRAVRAVSGVVPRPGEDDAPRRGLLAKLGGRLRDINPLVYRNCLCDAYDPEGTLRRIQIFALCAAAALLSLAWVVHEDHVPFVTPLTVAVFWLTVLWHLLLVFVGAATISRERHRGSIDSLLATRMSPTQHILGHAFGAVLTTAPTVAGLLAVVFCGVSLGGFDPAFALSYLVVLAGTATWVVGTAVLLSLTSTSPDTATGLTLAPAALFWLLPILSDHWVRILTWLLPVLLLPLAVAVATLYSRVEFRRQVGAAATGFLLPLTALLAVDWCRGFGWLGKQGHGWYHDQHALGFYDLLCGMVVSIGTANGMTRFQPHPPLGWTGVAFGRPTAGLSYGLVPGLIFLAAGLILLAVAIRRFAVCLDMGGRGGSVRSLPARGVRRLP